MKVDGSRKWYYDKGEWKGKKLTPTDGFYYSKLNGEPGYSIPLYPNYVTLPFYKLSTR